MIHYTDERVTLHHGDCLDVLRELPDNSVDAVVCDPPYGLANTTAAQVADTLVRWVNGERDYIPAGSGFMGRSWDAFVPPVAVWDECYRVLKPGGHVLAFAGARTHDLMGLGIRLAGFDIRDSIIWNFASGFPKSLDVSKALDKVAGAEREVLGLRTYGDGQTYGGGDAAGRSGGHMGAVVARAPSLDTAPATDVARQWHGWGTALKPAQEPIVVARKPLSGTVAANVTAWGTGALNIDATRVRMSQEDADFIRKTARPNTAGQEHVGGVMNRPKAPTVNVNDGGRWPTNVVLTHAYDCGTVDQPGPCVEGCPVREMDAQSGVSGSSEHKRNAPKGAGILGAFPGDDVDRMGHTDSGGASRFFPTFRYEAKAPTVERPRVQRDDGTYEAHATVKPLDLMRWLVRLVTPPGGTVLEPFAGSGTTAEACVIEGMHCIAIEREADYLPLIVARLSKPIELDLFGGVA